MSEQSFTVAEVEDYTRDWDGQKNSHWTSHYVKVAGDSRRFEVVRKRGNDGPKVGEVIEATVEERQHNGNTYYKLRPPQNNNFNGGGGKKEWREDPDRQHRIVRQHSQTVGVALVEMAIGSGIVKRPESPGALFELLRKTFDWLDRDVDIAVANRALSIDDSQRRSEEGF